MKSGKFWVAVLVTGVAMNVIDFVFQGMMMMSIYYSKMPDLFNVSTNPIWYLLGDFIAVLVLASVYDRVSSSFSPDWKGGAEFGTYAGILVNFPTWIFLHLMIKGFPYGLSWISTIYGIVWTIIAGAIVAALYKKDSRSPAA